MSVIQLFADPNLEEASLRVLVVANLYPHPGAPDFGTFVRDEVEALRDLGVGVDVFFVNGKASKTNYLRAYPPFWRQLKGRPYQLVHAHYALSGLIAMAQRRLPSVITFHGSEVKIGLTAPLSRLLARHAAAVIVTSRWVQETLAWPSAVVIPPGINLQRFRPLAQTAAREALGLSLSPHDKYVLFAGQMRPDKRVPVIRQAVQILQNGGMRVNLLIASGQPHEKVPVYMNAADALVLISDYEGSPMVIKEAMACNLPIVSGDLGDAKTVIGDTAGCYICDRSAEDTAAKLKLALAFGRRTDGRQRMQVYALSTSAHRVSEVYRRVIARGNAML